MIYLSIPYTADPRWSFLTSNEFTAEIMKRGQPVFAPISQGHILSKHLPEAMVFDHEFWMKLDLPMIDLCSAMIVVNHPNNPYAVEKSKGVQAEMKRAKEGGKTVFRVTTIRDLQEVLNVLSGRSQFS